jgi:hypothetical protein
MALLLTCVGLVSRPACTPNYCDVQCYLHPSNSCKSSLRRRGIGYTDKMQNAACVAKGGSYHLIIKPKVAM